MAGTDRGGRASTGARSGERTRTAAAAGRRAAALGVALTLATALGASAKDAGGDPVLAELGKETYQRRCASCHGLDARGDGPVAKVLRKPPTDLTRIAASRGGDFPAGEIARFIDGRFDVTAHGTRDMPVWGQVLSADVPDGRLAEELTRGTVASLVEYLKAIQVGGADGAEAGDGS